MNVYSYCFHFTIPLIQIVNPEILKQNLYKPFIGYKIMYVYPPSLNLNNIKKYLATKLFFAVLTFLESIVIRVSVSAS